MNFRNCIVEFIGTFFLVFTIGCVSLLGGDGVINALAIGFALMIMVYAGGHISGGHYNPAVSLAAVIGKALPATELIPYVISQLLGAAGAVILVNYFSGHVANYEGCAFNFLPMIVGEFLFTFALCYVVLMTAASRNTKGNSYFGLAIRNFCSRKRSLLRCIQSGCRYGFRDDAHCLLAECICNYYHQPDCRSNCSFNLQLYKSR